MGRLLGVVLVLVIVVAGLGFYLGWFHLTTTSDNRHMNVNVSVDKDKFERDKVTAEQKLEHAGEKVKNSVENTVHSAKKESPAATKPDYERDASARLQSLQAQIDRLRAQAAEAKAELKPKIDRAVAELEVKKEKASRELEELRASGEQKWQEMKPRVDNALDDLQKAYDRIVADLK